MNVTPTNAQMDGYVRDLIMRAERAEAESRRVHEMMAEYSERLLIVLPGSGHGFTDGVSMMVQPAVYRLISELKRKISSLEEDQP